MVELYAVHYNFLRIHKTLRVIPAMAAESSQNVLSSTDIFEMIDADTPLKSVGFTKRQLIKFQTETLPSSL